MSLLSIQLLWCHFFIPSILDLDFGTGCTLSLVSVWLKECRHSYQYLRDIMTLDCIRSLDPYLIFGYISLDTRLDLTFTLYELKKTLFR
jgi:deoxyribodipyrimidine photolyase